MKSSRGVPAAGHQDSLTTGSFLAVHLGRPATGIDPVICQRLRGSPDAQTGSSRLIHRVLLMSEPASTDSNELTDKGYTNQRAALTCRAALVQQLYAEPPGAAELIVIEV